MQVTSLAEVWIEITRFTQYSLLQSVTSLAEVWIEIVRIQLTKVKTLVTSLAEVWIEIKDVLMKSKRTASHFPCGSVDRNCNFFK